MSAQLTLTLPSVSVMPPHVMEQPVEQEQRHTKHDDRAQAVAAAAMTAA
jgi:hypothetical protein